MEYLSEPERKADQLSLGTSRNSLPRSCQSMKQQEKLKQEKPSLSYADFHHEITKNSKFVPQKFAGDPRKQRITGKEVDEDELVKYMSNLPSYLQRGETLQEKALNVGVLDWGLLEKWQYRHKQMPCRSSRYSLSSSNTSSSFSTDGSSTHSSRGHSCSPTRQRTRRPSFQSHLTASLIEGSPQAVASSGASVKNFQDTKTTQSDALNRSENFRSTAPALSKRNPNVELDECKKDASEQKRESDRGSGTLQNEVNIGMASRTMANLKTQAFEGTIGENKILKPNLENSQHTSPKESRKIVLLLPRGLPESKNPAEPPQDSNLAASARRKAKVCHRSYSEGSKKACHAELSSDIRHSCPLPSGFGSEESQLKQPSSRDSGAVSTNYARCLSKSVSQPLNMGLNASRGRNFEEKTSTAVPSCSTSVQQSKALEQKPKKAMAEKVRSISPFSRFTNGTSKTSRSSSLKDGSDICNQRSADASTKSGAENSRSSAGDALSSDKHNATGRARSSPLRRLLDPLLKPKAENGHHFVEPLGRASLSTDKACKSGDGQHVSVASRSAKVKLGMTGCKKINVNEFVMDKKHGPSTTHALFRVAVKNGLPLYTFAVNSESNILAATVKKLNAEKKDGFSCIYTFFTIQDMKKKSGSWINQGGKGKGHDYISNVVAQMKVSDSGFSHLSNKFTLREFVLFSVDLRQAEDQSSEFQPNNELAAVVVKFPKKNNQSTMKDKLSENTSCADSKEHSSGLPRHSSSVVDVPCQPFFRSEDFISTTVILPSAIHSLPSKGGPSSLIERWITGGSCDCGGWDMGCKLWILANQNQVHKKSSSSKGCPTADWLELFPQGGIQENQPLFSLAPFKEGIYSVEFHSSLSVLQAFSICTAVLDSRKQCQLLEPSSSLEEKSLGETMLVQNAGTSCPSLTEAEFPRYVSYPPHSPVGRV